MSVNTAAPATTVRGVYDKFVGKLHAPKAMGIASTEISWLKFTTFEPASTIRSSMILSFTSFAVEYTVCNATVSPVMAEVCSLN